jgi:hypothetical protein
MQRPITSGSFTIYGGMSGATGAYLQLFGEGQAANGHDIILGTENAYRYFFDYSANIHYWAGNVAGVQMSLNGASGDLTIAGQLNFDSILQSTDTTAILAAASGGLIYLRPNGAASSAEQVYIDANGDTHHSTDIYVGDASPGLYGTYAGAGLRQKAASNGAYGAAWVNFLYSGGLMYAYSGTTNVGYMNPPCDYRLKKAVQPLASMWEQVKALRPISYTMKAFRDLTEDDDITRWGFIAHELQGTLIESAASGHKDEKDVIQSPNLLVVLAAVTRALQEAQERIEALEAAA